MSHGWVLDLVGEPPTDAERRAVERLVAEHARDDADLLDLLQCLGLA